MRHDAETWKLGRDWHVLDDAARVYLRDTPPHPVPATHRMHPIYLACVDCGRTEEAIAFDRFASCLGERT